MNTSQTSKTIHPLFLCTCALMLLCSAVPAFAYCGGDGTPENPYQICNVNSLFQLANDANDYNKCFIMTADINLAGYDFNHVVIGYVNGQYFTFSGTFDGNGHKIINLTLLPNWSYSPYIGLFGSSTGEIKNLGLENVKITGGGMGGALAHDTYSATNCYATVDVNIFIGDFYLGGLVGYCHGNIINCHTDGKMNVIRYSGPEWGPADLGGIGGLVALVPLGGTCIDCYSTVDITFSGNYYNDYTVGGLAAGASMKRCFSSGDVTSTGGAFTGGLCGNGGPITQSFSTGNVTGDYYVGGLVGSGGNISNCYSTGDVTGNNYVGGLAGNLNNSTIENCYSTGVVNGGYGQYVGGLLGYSYFSTILSSYFLDTSGPDNNLGEPLDNNEMKQCANFAGWDFVWSICNNGPEYIWFIFEGVNYPQLAWYMGICTVPDVVGLYMSDANDKIIIERGFTVGAITYEHSYTVPFGRVISQNPDPNTQTDCGSSVSYVASKGPWPCEIPNIVGLTMADANLQIIWNGFTVGDISYGYSDTVPAGYVVSQNPAAGPSEECDLAINYTVSSGPIPWNGRVPDFDDDGIVNFVDFAIFADAWLTENALIDLTGDNYVNIYDLKKFCDWWLEED